ncbi:MAG: ABC transporter permease [Planctomycetota bacterium]
MIQIVNASWHLVKYECRRRRPFLLASIFLTLGAWAVALAAVRSLRTGESSFDLLFLATTLFATILASDAFGRDIGKGRIEFLYSVGATPAAVFTSRAFVTVLYTFIFSMVLLAIETIRLNMFENGPISKQWVAQSLSTVASNPREAFLLYVLPALCVFLFVSSVSSRTATAIGAGVLSSVLIFALDRFATLRAEAAVRQSLVSAAATILMIPAAVFLTGAAVWVRQFEPNRSRPRAVLLASAILLFGVRFAIIYDSGQPAAVETARITAIAPSPDGKRIAIEARHEWRPDEWLTSVGDFAGRPAASQNYEMSPRVAVADLTNPHEVHFVTNAHAEIDRTRSANPWSSERHLRIRGVQPEDFEDFGDSTIHSFVYDSQRRRIQPAPEIEFVDPAAASKTMWTRNSMKDAPAGDLTICKVNESEKLILTPAGEIYVCGAQGKRDRLWPAVK